MDMRRLFFYLVGILTLMSFTKSEEKDYPKDYFRSPIDYPILLSGTFGELRPNHFHAGIDIKGSVGKKIYSIADGYISRIKVSSGGYGNVLYVTHPNSYTSVYAHLSRFAGRYNLSRSVTTGKIFPILTTSLDYERVWLIEAKQPCK